MVDAREEKLMEHVQKPAGFGLHHERTGCFKKSQNQKYKESVET